MPDNIDRLLVNLSKAKLHIHMAALDTHDKELATEMLTINLALHNLSRKVNDQRTDAFDGTVMLMPRECNDCANGIKHPHPVVRKES